LLIYSGAKNISGYSIVKKITNICAAIIFLAIAPAPLLSQTTLYGGRGLLRTYSAETVGRSKFFINSYFLSFFESENAQASLQKDHTLALCFTYGLNSKAEFYARLTPYQDDQAHIWGPPGDSRLGFKFRTPLSGGIFLTAINLFASIPTGKNHNVPYEPYSSGQLGAAAMAILSFDFTESFPLFPLKANLNFGYFDQNVKDAPFASPEDQYLLAAGIKFPLRSSILYTEYSAEVFANNPQVTEYRYNSQRLTQGFKFLGPWDLIFDLALDLSLAKQPKDNNNDFLKKYADWKFIIGINYEMVFKKAGNPYEKNSKKPPAPQDDEALSEVHQKRQQVQDELKRMENSVEDKDSQDKQTDKKASTKKKKENEEPPGC